MWKLKIMKKLTDMRTKLLKNSQPSDTKLQICPIVSQEIKLLVVIIENILMRNNLEIIVILTLAVIKYHVIKSPQIFSSLCSKPQKSLPAIPTKLTIVKNTESTAVKRIVMFFLF